MEKNISTTLNTNNTECVIGLKRAYVCYVNYTSLALNTDTHNDSSDVTCKFKCDFIPDQKELAVRLWCEIGADGRDAVFTLAVCGEFNVNTRVSVNPEALEKVLKRNTVSILFPYLRTYVSNFTSATDLDAINIPVLNIHSILTNSETK